MDSVDLNGDTTVNWQSTTSNSESLKDSPKIFEQQETIQALQERIMTLVEEKITLQTHIEIMEHRIMEVEQENAMAANKSPFSRLSVLLAPTSESSSDDNLKRWTAPSKQEIETLSKLERNLSQDQLEPQKIDSAASPKQNNEDSLEETITELRKRVMVLIEEKLSLGSQVEDLDHRLSSMVLLDAKPPTASNFTADTQKSKIRESINKMMSPPAYEYATKPKATEKENQTNPKYILTQADMLERALEEKRRSSIFAFLPTVKQTGESVDLAKEIQKIHEDEDEQERLELQQDHEEWEDMRTPGLLDAGASTEDAFEFSGTNGNHAALSNQDAALLGL